MFRKAPQTKASANIKASERRRLLAAVVEQYGLPTNMALETERQILPATVKRVPLITSTGTPGALYTDNAGTPLWFSVGHPSSSIAERLVPTVYTLWNAPFVLPIVLIRSPVVEALQRGADLMLPGTVPPFDSRAHVGSVVAVADEADPEIAIAVGTVAQDLSGITYVVGTTGVAVRIHHVFEDTLSTLTKTKIRPPKEVSMEIKFKEEPAQTQDTEIDTNDSAMSTKHNENEKNESLKEDEEEQIDDQNHEEEQFSDAFETLSLEDIDNFFKRSLYQTLTQDKLDIPLSSSTFMNHIIKNIPSNHASIQIKKTSWKKTTKFLKAMEKEKFLKLKTQGDNIVIVSTAKAANNDVLKNFVPYKVKGVKSSSAEPKAKSASQTPANQLIVHFLYKPTSPVRAILNCLNLNFDKLYTTIEVRDILNKYISSQNLVNQSNKRTVILDDALKGIIKAKENTIGRDQIFEPFLKKFTEHYVLEKPNDPEQRFLSSKPIKGCLPKVEMISEMKLGRKVVTRIWNFEEYGIDAQELASELKVKCSGSTTIGKNIQNPKVTEVTVQGPHSKIITELLTKKYGLNPNWIKFTDKTKKKKKRTTPAPTA